MGDLAKECEERPFKKDATIITESPYEQNDEYCIGALIAGSAKVMRHGILVCELMETDAFWGAQVIERFEPPTIIAGEACKIFSVSRSALLKIIAKHPGEKVNVDTLQ